MYFDHEKIDLDVDGLRRGKYADPPYLNIVQILHSMSLVEEDTQLRMGPQHNSAVTVSSSEIADAVAETHWITRRAPFTIVAGMPKALSILKECAGYFGENGDFISTAETLSIDAVSDGTKLEYDGNALNAMPALVVKGRFRDFALLKTPILGTLARASRIATNTYRVLQAANGKPVYFFSARFDPPEVQAADGYAYHIGVKRFNLDTGYDLSDDVSTYANSEWWGGDIEGTISHEAVASFLGDTAMLMVKYAELLPPDRIRVALVDFHNDCIAETRYVMQELFRRYKECVDAGETERAERYNLHGVRVDTSRELVDVSIWDPEPSDYGPSPQLVRLLRGAINNAWHDWALTPSWQEQAERWCRRIKIMVSGGFTEEKIRLFEENNVPVDFYGVGSWMLSNCPGTGKMTDFSSVLMRLKVAGECYEIPKKGRRANKNPLLKPTSF